MKGATAFTTSVTRIVLQRSLVGVANPSSALMCEIGIAGALRGMKVITAMPY